VQPEPSPPLEPSKLEGWRRLIRQQRVASIQEKLQSVNVFFNRFEFVEDRYLWGREDYWATLFETLSVLTYSPEAKADPLVLDTVNQEILPVSRRTDLVPVYSFNQDGYWLARQQEGWKGKQLGDPTRLSRWWGLLQRVPGDRQNRPGG
jgi:predicted transglutaminase-like cysteine proteinase